MSVLVKALVLHAMAAAVCAAGACLGNTGISPGPGGPHCRSILMIHSLEASEI